VSLDGCLKSIEEAVASVRTDDPRMAEWLANYALNHRHRLAEDLDMVGAHARQGAKILEFGSIPPLLTLGAKRMGYDIHGLDIAPERFSTAIREHNLDIRKVDFEREPVPFRDETFELVLFNEVFEHLRIDLIFTMGEVARVMKTGGKLLLSTPNLRSVRGLWNLLIHGTAGHIGTDLYEEYDQLRRYGHMGHVREYTPREVSRLLLRLGLVTRRRFFRYNRSRRKTGWRPNPLGLFEGITCALVPTLKPVFSLVCEKVAPTGE
jgi:SAM-dependent methyltransferase